MRFARSLLAALSAAAVLQPALAHDLGVNIHRGTTAAANTQVATLMAQRNLRVARMDLPVGQDTAALRDQAQKIRANGGRVQVSLQTSYQWDASCNPNLAAVEQDAYAQATTTVDAVKDIVSDFELLNEVQLRPEIQREVPFNSAGTSTAPYAGKPCVATMAAALRGMSRAVQDARARSGLPLRVILGVVGRDFGFLAWMRQQGVAWDVTGFHIYPRAGDNSLLGDPWYGTGGPLAQLAAFGKPVHINEFHCGEIYDAGYENQAGLPGTENCLLSLARHLSDLRRQAIANVESVLVYELLDEPAKPQPENRFGLLFDLASPKPALFVATAFAGGQLSATERAAITSRGLLTDAQITAMQQATTVASGDTAPPQVALTGPSTASPLRTAQAFWASAVASDNVAVKQVRFSVPGSACVSTAAPWNCQLVAPRKKGSYTVTAEATDTAGNAGTSALAVTVR